MMLEDYGRVGVDLAPLIAAVQSIPASRWVPRSDPESKDTLAIRENDPHFPTHLILPVLDAIGRQAFGRGYFNRVVLSKVPAGMGILPHTDDVGAQVRMTSVHCHLPLITHESIIVGGPEGEVHLPCSHLFTMDISCRHWVRNPSAVDRVHLLFAYFPEAGLQAA